MPEPKPTAATRDFQDVLTDLDEGRVHEQLTALWPAVVKAVRETNKVGSLTLTLTAKLERGTMVVVVPTVATKMPAPATGPTLFYTDEEGNLTRDDPKQIPLKVVAPTPIRTPKEA
jgi:hypothetical protein